jgi:hypothetical protein
MKRITMIAAAAAFALASTSAMAGGFKYGSAGGNFGKWAYGDGAAGGDAKIVGLGYGETSSERLCSVGIQRGRRLGHRLWRRLQGRPRRWGPPLSRELSASFSRRDASRRQVGACRRLSFRYAQHANRACPASPGTVEPRP